MKQMQPWYWRSLPLENRTGSAVFAALFDPDSNPDAIATLLESPYSTLQKQCLRRASPTQLARYSICAGAPRIVDRVAQLWTPPVGEILPFLQQLLQVASGSSPLVSPDPPVPFTGGWLGWLGYDLAWEIEQLPHLKKDTLPFPVAYWYEPECFAVLDHWEQILWLAASDPSQLEQLQSRLDKEAGGAEVAGEAGGEKPLTIYHSL
ncbi:MAG TPA: aminodeoxychorismate synthase component I, partial [Cyanobacteria bacterium UBA11049]|nr:aminodeoxychorismate synthase component I [Cyanobacteria bacterium UBA11049]